MNPPTVPFLMYHAIRSVPGTYQVPGTSAAEVDPVYTVTLDEFEQQLAYLRRSGFHTVTLTEFLAWHRYGDPLPTNPIVLTFDDGDPSHFELALPRLTQYGFRAVFAVVPSWIGTTRSFSIEQLHTLQTAGMEIISHGMHHIPLTDLELPQLREELFASRTQLEVWLGKPIQALAIPRGYCSVRVRQIAYEAGYQVICTSRPDRNHRDSDPYNLGRIPIKADMSPEEFADLVQAHPIQRALQLAGYLIRTSFQRLLGPKRYDRLRGFLLRLSAQGATRHA